MTESIAVICLSAGCFFLLLGSIGVIRFPDFYSRAHAMSKPDTMGLILSLTGLALLNGWNLTSLKLLVVVFFVAIVNSSTTHALVRAALRNGLKPWTKGDEIS